MKSIFEKNQRGQRAYSLPQEDALFKQYMPPVDLLRQTPLLLPEVSELDLTRHFIGLSRRNVGIDNVFYPLGSCTMKFNPRINEYCAHLPGFTRMHPLAPDEYVQGSLRVIDELLALLISLTGMAAGSLLPNAGAQGELVGVKMIAAYHKAQGDEKRCEFLVPDSAHGTNPASVAMAGFKVRVIPTNEKGDIDLTHLENALSEYTAGLMLTNPNTLGLFSSHILRIAELVHGAGGLLYYDGANLNPLLGIAKPGEMGFNVMHINLHKTFSTPHGGGGPGSGPVLCDSSLQPFLPIPRVEKKAGGYVTCSDDERSIGRIASFHGNFGIYLRAYVYARLHGHYGLRRIAELAVLNANYLKKRLSAYFHVPFPQHCMHEFVVQADQFLPQGIRAFDIAKRMLDYGVHSPTVYFPLTVKECFLIEPTECESKITLDDFVDIVKNICIEAQNDPGLLKKAPYNTPSRRLDEVLAAKQPVLVAPLLRLNQI